MRANRRWWQRRRQKVQEMRRLQMEVLEPRVLFSASPAPVEPPAEAPEPVQAQQSDVEQDVTKEQVDAAADAGIARWLEAGITDEQLAALQAIDYSIEDLAAGRLGSAEGMTVTIDVDAAGEGWFVDGTPMLDEEFADLDGALGAVAAEGFDLLTVVMHEQGHVLGLLDQPGQINTLMEGVLSVGERLLPEAGEATGATAGSLDGVAYITAANPHPDVSVGLSPGQGPTYIGDNNVEFQITFDNNSGQTGYSPYVDLVVPSQGADGSSELFTATQWEDTSGLAGMVDLTQPAERFRVLSDGTQESTTRFPDGLLNLGRLEYTAGMQLENPNSGAVVTPASQGANPGDPLQQLRNGRLIGYPVGNYTDIDGNDVGIPARWSADPAEFDAQMEIVFGGLGLTGDLTALFDAGGVLADYAAPNPGEVIYHPSVYLDLSASPPAPETGNILTTRIGNTTYRVLDAAGDYVINPSAPVYDIITIDDADPTSGGTGSLDFGDTLGGSFTDTDGDGAFDWLDLDPNDAAVSSTYINAANGLLDAGGDPINPFPDGIGNVSNITNSGLDLASQDLVQVVHFVDTDGDGIGEAVHPLFGDPTDPSDPERIVVYGNPGDILYAIQLPFGSFTDGQPPETITFTADVSNMADADHELTYYAAGGYLLGCDEFDNHIIETPVDANNDGVTDYVNLSVGDEPIYALTPGETPVTEVVTAPSNTPTDFGDHVAEFGFLPSLMDVHKHIEAFSQHHALGVGPNNEQTFYVNMTMAQDQVFHSFIIDDKGPTDAIVKQIQLQQANSSGQMVDMDFNSVAFVEYFDEHGQTHVFYNQALYDGTGAPSNTAPTVNAAYTGSVNTPDLPVGVEYIPFDYSTSTFFTGSLEQEVLVGDYDTNQNNPTIHTGPGGGVPNTFIIPLELQHPGNNFKLTFHNEDLDGDGTGDSTIVGQKVSSLDGLGRQQGDLVVSYDFYYSEFDAGVTGGPTTLIDSEDADGDGHEDGIDDENQVGTEENPRNHSITGLDEDAENPDDDFDPDHEGDNIADGDREPNTVQVSPIHEGLDPRDSQDPVRLNAGLDDDTSDPLDDDNRQTSDDVPNFGGNADSTDVPIGTDKSLKVLNQPDFGDFDDPDRLQNHRNGQVSVGSVIQYEIVFGISDFVAIANVRIGASATDVSNPDHEQYDPSATQIQRLEFRDDGVAGTTPGGTYRLDLNGTFTGPIAYNASTADIQAAVDAAWGAGVVTISGDSTTGIDFNFDNPGAFDTIEVDPAGLTGGLFPPKAAITQEGYDPRLDPTNASFDWAYVLGQAGGVSGDRMSDGQRLLFEDYDPNDTEYAALVEAARTNVLGVDADRLSENGGEATTGLVNGANVDFTPEIQLSGYNHFSDDPATAGSTDRIIKFSDDNWSFVRNTDSRNADGFQDFDSVNQGQTGSDGTAQSDDSYTGQTFIQFDISKELMDQDLTEDAGVGGALIGGLYFENDDVVVYDNDQHLNNGEVQVIVRYWAVVEDQYTESFPSGNPSLNEAERLSNEYDLTFDVVESRYDDDDADDQLSNGTGDEDPVTDGNGNSGVDSSVLGDEEPDTGAGPGEEGGFVDPILGPDGKPHFDIYNTITSGGGGTEDVPIGVGTIDKSIFAIRETTDQSTWGIEFPDGPDGNNGILPRIQPGDTVTYRLTQTFPLGDFEDLVLADFLPQPLYDVTRPDYFNDTSSTTDNLWEPEAGINDPNNAGLIIPGVGSFAFGPNHGLSIDGSRDASLFTITPTVGYIQQNGDGSVTYVDGEVDAANNQVAFNFGTYDDPDNNGVTVDLLFTLTASGNPMADELFLTNKVQSYQGNTFLEPQEVGDIVMVQVESPEVNILKGIIDVDRATRAVTTEDGDEIQFIPEIPNNNNASPTFVGAGSEVDANGDTLPDAIGPLDVAAWMTDPTLGGATTSVISSDLVGYDGETFTGINSPIDADVVGADEGDLVTFALTLVNTGHADGFDLTIRDSIGSKFSIPAGGINLQARAGDGTLISTGTWFENVDGTDLTTDGSALFGDGIRLLDPTEGVLDQTQQLGIIGGLETDDTSDGSNVVIVTYQLLINEAVAAAPTTNLAILENYTSRDDGDNFVIEGQEPADIANVTATPTIAKRLVPDSDSQANTALNDTDGLEVVVGETFDYEVDLELIEGRISNATVRDWLDDGLGFVNADGTGKIAEAELVSKVSDSDGVFVGSVTHDESGNLVEILDASGAVTTIAALETAAGVAAGTLSYLGGAVSHVTADSNDDGVVTFLEEVEDAANQIWSEQIVEFRLGDIENTNRLNFVSETIRLTYKVVALDSQDTNAGDLKNNWATIFYDNDQDDDNSNNNVAGGDRVNTFRDDIRAEDVRVREPQLLIEKTVADDPNAPGGFVYELVVRHRGEDFSSSAYDISLYDPIPPGMDPTTVNVLSAVKTNFDGTTTDLSSGGTGEIGTVIQNEIQTITSNYSGGTFEIEFDGLTTSAALPHNATAAQIQAALESLATIDSGDVIVTGGPLDTGSISVEFVGGLADTNVEALNIVNSLTGGADATIAETAPAGTRNEIQALSLSATTGTFQIEFDGEVTNNGSGGRINLPFNASADDIQAALGSLPSYGASDFIVTGGPLGSGDVFVEFAGVLAGQDVPNIEFAATGSLDGIPLQETVLTNFGGEVQTLSSNMLDGNFKLTFNGEETVELAHDATIAQIQAALEELTAIGEGNVRVTGGDMGFNPVLIEFIDSMSTADQPLIEITSSTLTGISSVAVQEPALQFFDTSDVDLLHSSDASLPDGAQDEFITIRYSVSIDPLLVQPGDVIVNTASIDWTSINGDPGQASTFYGDSTERTGDTSDPGSFNNDHRWQDSASVLIPGQSFTKEIGSLNTDGEKTLAENLQWDFTNGQPDGWTLENGSTEWRSNDGGGVRATGDATHDNLLFTSPSFQFDGSTLDGATLLAVELAGGQGDQDGLGAQYNTPNDVISANGGTSTGTGQKGFAIYNVATGVYDAHFFKSGNGGTETINVTAADLPAGFDFDGVYEIHFYDTDDGSWGWGQLNDVQISRFIADPTSLAHTTGTDLTIGETIDYVLTASFENGDLGGVVITDRLPLLDGTMEYVADSYQIRVGSNLDVTNLDESLHVDPTTRLVNAAGIAHLLANGFFTETDSNGDGINDEISWNLGSVTALTSTETDAHENQIQIALQALVKQDTDNSGTVPTNGDLTSGLRGRYIYSQVAGGSSGETSSVSNALRIVNSQEPDGDFLVYGGIDYRSGGSYGGGNLGGFFGEDRPASTTSGQTDDNFIVNLEGYIEIEPNLDQDPTTSGIQVDLELFSDRGSKLWIDGAEVLSRDGFPSTSGTDSATTTYTFNTPGLHRIQLVGFNDGGDARLELQVNGSTDYGDLLFHQSDSGTLQPHLNGEFYDLHGHTDEVRFVEDRFDTYDHHAEFVSLTGSHTGSGTLGGFLGVEGTDYTAFHQPQDKDISLNISTGMADESLLGIGMDRAQIHLDGVIQVLEADDLDGDLSNGIQVAFTTSSDDGSVLYVDNDLVVNNDGSHGAPGPGAGPEVHTFFHEGFHELDLYYFEGAGGEELTLSMDTAGGTLSGNSLGDRLFHQSAMSGDILTNTATMVSTAGVVSDSVDVEVVEPELEIRKYVTDPVTGELVDFDAAPVGDAGDVFTYTINVDHTPDSTANAYDLVIQDLLSDPRLELVPGSVRVIENLALNGTASQSSTGAGGTADRAIDGNTDGNWGLGSTTHTNGNANNWWQVDLGASAEMDEVVLFNRADCCGLRLSNFRVSVWDGDPASGGTEVWGQDYFSSGSVDQGGSFALSAEELGDNGVALGDVSGRFVRVQLNGLNNEGNGTLSLAEVQVFGATATSSNFTIDESNGATVSFNEFALDGPPIRIELDARMTDAIQADALEAGSQEKVVNTVTLQYDNISGDNPEQRVITDADVALVAGLTPTITKEVVTTQFTQTGSTDSKDDNLVIHYQFEDGNGQDPVDSTGNTTASIQLIDQIVDGVDSTNPTSVDGATGALGLSFQGDVVGDQTPDRDGEALVRIANNATIQDINNPAVQDGWTVSFWVNGDAAQGNNVRPLGLGGVFEASSSGSGDELTFFVDDGSGFASVGNTGVVFDNSWHHVAMTVDLVGDTENIRIYTDGVLADTVTLDMSGATGGSLADILLGSRLNGDPLYDGSLDDFRVYSTALTGSQVACLIEEQSAPGPDLADAGFEDSVQDGFIARNGADEESLGSENDGLGLISTDWIFSENAGVIDSTASSYGSTAVGSGQVGIFSGDNAEMSQTVEGFQVGDTYMMSFDAVTRNGIDNGELEVVFESVDGNDTQTFNLGEVNAADFSGAVSFEAKDEGYHVTVRSLNTLASGLVETIYDVNSVTNPTSGNVVSQSVVDGPVAGNIQNGTGPWAIIGTNETIVYTGEFFDADGIFAFAENIDDVVQLYIDGQQVIYNWQWNVASTSTTDDGHRVHSGTVGESINNANRGSDRGILDFGMGANNDGWHTFELRLGNGSGGAGAAGETGGGANDWSSVFGFGLADPTSGDTADLPATADGEGFEVPDDSRFRAPGAGVILVDNFSFTNITPEAVVPEVVVGELVTYHITVEVPEGTTENLVITDDLNLANLNGDELTFVNAFVVDPSTGNPLTGAIGNFQQADGSSLLASEVAISETDGVTTFNLGTVVAPGDNDVSNNTITLAVQAYVPDLANHVEDDAFVNTATMNYDALVGDVLTEQEATDTAEVVLVEQDLYIVKNVEGDNMRFPTAISDALSTTFTTSTTGTGPVSIEVGVELPDLFPTSSTADQVIWEVGGNTGMSLNLVDGNRVQLSVREVLGDGTAILQTIEAELPAALSEGFAQFVVTADPATDTIQLFINGSHVDTATLANFSAWSDGSALSLGSVVTGHGGADPLELTSQMADFTGAITDSRFYTDVLTAAEVQNNYYSLVGIPSGDAGDTFHYTLDVAHHGDMDVAVFDVEISDLFVDPRVTLVPGTVVATVYDAAGAPVAPNPATVTPVNSGTGFNITLAELQPDWSVRVTFDGQLGDAADPNEQYNVDPTQDNSAPNTASVAWDNNPLEPGDEGFNDERTGDGDSDSAHVETVGEVLFEKVIVGTSLTETGSDQHNELGYGTGDIDLGVPMIQSLDFGTLSTNHGDSGRLNSDFDSIAGTATPNWYAAPDSEWSIAGGTLALSPSAPYSAEDEGGVATMIDLTQLADIEGSQIRLRFDYDVGAGNTLYTHLRGADDDNQDLQWDLNLLTSNGDVQDASFGGTGTRYNLFSGDDVSTETPLSGAGANARALTGSGTFDEVIDISGYDVSDLADYDWLALAFGVDATTDNAVTISGLYLGAVPADDFEDVVVGETVTYELRATIGEGSYDDFVVTDVLPAGFELVGVDILESGNTANMRVGTTELDALDLSVGAGIVSVSGQTVTMDFGTVINPGEEGLDIDTVAIRVVTRATDVAAVADASVATNTATLETEGESHTDIASVDIVEPQLELKKFVENADGDLSDDEGDTTAEEPVGDAGDVFTYTLVVDHSMFDDLGDADASNDLQSSFDRDSGTFQTDGSGDVSMYDTARNSSSADAFDVVITDTLSDSRITLHSALSAISVVLHTDGVPATTALTAGVDYTIAADADGSGFVISMDSLALNQALVVTYDARLTGTVGPNETVPNTASVDWSSHPDENTGRAGETQSDDAHVDTIGSIQFEKVIVSTSLDETGASQHTDQGDATGDNDISGAGDDHVDVAAGETVTYELRTIIGDGTYENLRIADTFPVGFEFVSAQILASGNTAAMTEGGVLLEQLDLSAGGPVLTVGAQTLDFDFLSLVNPGDAGQQVDQFAIQITMRVANDGQLADGDTATNTATLSSGEDFAPITDIAVVDVVAPVLDLEKFVSNQDNFIPGYYGLNDDGNPLTLDAGAADHDGDDVNNDTTVATLGETLVYRLEAQHTAESTSAAYNVNFYDDIAQMGQTNFGEIVEGSIRVIDLNTGAVLTEGVDYTDSSTTTVLDVQLSQPFLLTDGADVAQRYAVEFIVELSEEASLLLERGGVDSVDILNVAELRYDTAPTEGSSATDTDAAEVMIVAPDLYITKNDGEQTREPGETYTYTLDYGNKESHDAPFSEQAGPARNVVITDTLPEELTYTGASVTPDQVVVNADGTTSLVWNIELLNPGDTGAIEVDVVVKDDLPPAEYEIINQVEIGSDFFEPILSDNADQDLDVMVIEALGAEFFGGSSILEGFRLIGGIEDGEDGIGEGDGEDFQLLTPMPFYSGLVDPGTVLKIKILGAAGAPLPNGEMTVVGDAGGNWLAKFPGLVLTDQPHQIVIEQTRPVWDIANDRHGYNLRTYFAPAINPSHTQTEEMTVDAVMGRRLHPLEEMQDEGEGPRGNMNHDWRLSNFELYAQSGIGGVQQ